MHSVTVKAHDLVSSKLLLPLSQLQRRLRPSRRAAAVAYAEGLRFRHRAAGWSADRKSEWILDRLRFVVRRAARETAYYRDLFERVGFDPRSDFTFEDYARLPVLEREQVKGCGRSLISSAVAPDRMQKDSTGGSTGMPTEIWLGPEEIGWRESAGEYFKQRLGVATGTRTALFWGHHLDPVASDRLRDRYYSFATNIRWFDCFRLSGEVLDRYHHEFERWRPTCVIAYANALGALAEHVRERGYKPSYPARCFITGAEKLLPYHREIIVETFRRPVHERYGSRDAGYIAYQMNPDRALDYEIDWANLLIEPEAAGSESSILVTKLHADAMPMLRYRIGDIGRFGEGSRAGHPALALPEVVGRSTDRIWLPDGRWVNGNQMPHMMKDYPVREFMLVQRADYSIELNLVPESGFGEESRKGILSVLAANLERLPVEIRLVDEIPRTRANKRRPVVSEVKASERVMS